MNFWRDLGTWMLRVIGTVVLAALVLEVLSGSVGMAEMGIENWMIVIVGVATVVFMGEQVRAANTQWRLMAWDKRYEVYRTAMRFMGRVVDVNGVTKEMMEEFFEGLRDKHLLFGEDVQKALTDVLLNASRLKTVDEKRAGLQTEEGIRLSKEAQELIEWFDKSRWSVEKAFQPYLAVRRK